MPVKVYICFSVFYKLNKVLLTLTCSRGEQKRENVKIIFDQLCMCKIVVSSWTTSYLMYTSIKKTLRSNYCQTRVQFVQKIGHS
jgi:hypothetical protein